MKRESGQFLEGVVGIDKSRIRYYLLYKMDIRCIECYGKR